MLQENDGFPSDFGFRLTIIITGIIVVALFVCWIVRWWWERCQALERKRTLIRRVAEAQTAFVWVLMSQKYDVSPSDVIVHLGTDGQLDCTVSVTQNGLRRVLHGECYPGGKVWFDRTWYLFPRGLAAGVHK